MSDHDVEPTIAQINTKTGLGLSPEEWWMNHSARGDWARGKYFQRFELDRATPAVMDALWSDGWRHFGSTFFRDYFNVKGKRLVRVIPLRIDLAAFKTTRDQRRILNKNQDLEVSFRPISITEEHSELFKRHAQRFEENRPPTLYSFLSLSPVFIPCPSLMCEIRSGGRLLAASFFDLGAQSTSSIYAMFDPDEQRRSLGHYTLLCEIAYAQQHGRDYVYTGYAHLTPSYYDYKKRYRGSEFYDWRSAWRPIEELSSELFPTHRFETSDIPDELLYDDDQAQTTSVKHNSGEEDVLSDAEDQVEEVSLEHQTHTETSIAQTQDLEGEEHERS